MLYQLHALGMETLQPLHQTAKTARFLLSHPLNPFSGSFLTRHASAAFELYERLTAYYEKPEFGFTHVEIDGQRVPIRQEVVHALPYCDLLHFRREGQWNHRRMLLVAPLSGHYATLLRNTVAEFLPDHDVFITDWRNARDVPLEDGPLHLDDYVEYIMDFLRFLGPETHVMAVCQPCVPVLMALSVMAMAGEPTPPTMSLLAGPIDARNSPTEVNDYASYRDYEWFERNVIFKVPEGFQGAGQRVYPGFIQLSGFLSLNLNNHISRHYKFYKDLVKNDGESSEAHRVFYNEYLAVLDMSAPFYLETIQRVFMRYELASGRATYRGQHIDPAAIKKTALFTLEGGKDDITGRGQTQAAQALCSNIPQSRRQHHEEPLVGHYGVFNGRHFRESVAPKVKEFMARHSN